VDGPSALIAGGRLVCSGCGITVGHRRHRTTSLHSCGELPSDQTGLPFAVLLVSTPYRNLTHHNLNCRDPRQYSRRWLGMGTRNPRMISHLDTCIFLPWWHPPCRVARTVSVAQAAGRCEIKRLPPRGGSPWTQCGRNDVVLLRCHPRNSARLPARAAAPRMKKAPRMNGRLTKPATQAVRAVKSAVAGEVA
jgi:hypothetical protein